MVTVICIDCQQPIELDKQLVNGTIVVCPYCGTDMEVINVDPIELDWIYLQPLRREDYWRLEDRREKGEQRQATP